MATGFTPFFTKVTALCINASTVVLACKQFLICADFSPDSDEATFSLEKAKPWIEESYFSQKWKIDLFSSNMQLFTLQEVNECTTLIFSRIFQNVIA